MHFELSSRTRLQLRKHVRGVMRLRSAIICVLCCALAPSAAVCGSIYARWKNGPPSSEDFFPIAVWWQNPAVMGNTGKFPSVAAAAASMGINVYLGEGGWPENFGSDNGELETAKEYHQYIVGGIYTPYNENTSAQSVASVLALANKIGAQRNVIGYNMGDEPDCSGDDNNGLSFAKIPAAVAELETYDNTRLVTFNQSFWPMQPYWWGVCGAPAKAALRAISIGSMDYYPVTNANLISYDYHYPGNLPSHYYAGKSDFRTIANDTLWVQGIATQALIRAGAPGQPTWVFVESGGDNLDSGGYNNFPGSVQANSTTLTNKSGWSRFTTLWEGLAVSGNGIPASTTIVKIIDSTHAELSQPASTTVSSEAITVADDCRHGANLCVVNGNEYRPTASQVNSEVWLSLLSGANGIEYFCNDATSDFFCLGGTSGGAAARETRENLTFVDAHVRQFARQLNAPTIGACAMVNMLPSGVIVTVPVCTNGLLTMATDRPLVPGVAMAKSYKGATYLFAMSDRRSSNGAQFTFTLAGAAGRTAKIVFDSNAKYHPTRNTTGKHIKVSVLGGFTDAFGLGGDDYQVKAYEIQ
jgi:hypothetical protein